MTEEIQQHISIFFFKTNLFKERIKKSVALLTREKPLTMYGEKMIDFLQALYNV